MRIPRGNPAPVEGEILIKLDLAFCRFPIPFAIWEAWPLPRPFAELFGIVTDSPTGLWSRQKPLVRTPVGATMQARLTALILSAPGDL